MLPQPGDAVRQRRPRLPLRQGGLRALCCLLLALLLGACSARVFFYNRLDFLIPWYVNGYVDLDRSQNEQLDALLEPLLYWHRTRELPRYAELVAETRELAAGSAVSAAALEELALEAEIAWYRLRDRALEQLLQLGETLTGEQVAEFVDELREKQADYEEEYLSRSDAEYRDEALESLEDNLADYLGRLDGAQVERLRSAADALRRLDRDWLEVRGRWVDRIALALAREPGWQDQLREAVRDWESLATESYLNGVEHNSATILAAVADVLALRSERQDRRLERELQGLSRDIEKLVAQTPATAPADLPASAP